MANPDPVDAAMLNEQITTTDPTVLAATAINIPPPQPPPAQTTPQAAPETAAPAVAPVTAPPQALVTPNQGIGVEGEFNVWEGRYSMKNFIGRFLFRMVLTIAWIALAIYVWGGTTARTQMMGFVTIATGIVLLAFWLYLLWQVLVARMSHHYRLTNRRLFVSTGIFDRRRDQVELLNVKDLYIRQPSLFHRWSGVGTIVIESSEQKLPITYLTGVDDPKEVMDLVWHCARSEREGKAVQVERV